MTGYSTREVAEVTGLSADQVRGYARSGLLSPGRGSRNEYLFSFTDVILLRTARELREQDVPARRIRRALLHLAEQLPEGRPLSAVRISAEGDQVVVRDRDTVWEPETGQMTFDFSVGELASEVEPFARRAADHRPPGMAADDWYDLGLDLEAVSVSRARAAYEEALRLAPDHVEAHLNLGRLLHEQGALSDAEGHYRRAREADPGNPLASYNLGVVLEDRDRVDEAKAAYRAALDADPAFAGAHFNLAGLCERTGDAEGAVRHLAAYKRLKDVAPRAGRS